MENILEEKDGMTRELIYIIPAEYNEKKLLSFLKGELHISARLLTKLKKDPKGLLLNGEHIRSVDTVFSGDRLVINLPCDNNLIEPVEKFGIDVIYEDSDILVLNKPAFLAMHPTHNHQGDTLANEVTAYLMKKGSCPVFRAVGRLDKTTSGVVVCALNSYAASMLSGKLLKEYIAIAGGEMHGEGTIDKPIYRPDPCKTLRAAGENGEHAVTHYKVLKTDGKISVLRVITETGRTHQIRVHMAYIGHPLAGDEMYGSDIHIIGRAALHCLKVKIVHPVTREEMEFEAPLPEDMKNFI